DLIDPILKVGDCPRRPESVICKHSWCRIAHFINAFLEEFYLLAKFVVLDHDAVLCCCSCLRLRSRKGSGRITVQPWLRSSLTADSRLSSMAEFAGWGSLTFGWAGCRRSQARLIPAFLQMLYSWATEMPRVAAISLAGVLPTMR